MFALVLAYLQMILFKALYFIRNHDKNLICNSVAFKDHPEATINLESPECGLSGGILRDHHTCLDEDGQGKLPELRWNLPPTGQVAEFVLIVEDPDVPIPFMVFTHGLFFGIPATCLAAYNEDVEKNCNVDGRVTYAGWHFVPNLLGSAYVGAAAPYGHGFHRYVFTIVALSEPLQFVKPDKVTVGIMKAALVDKVLAWGQWVGHFKRPLPR
ncbi:PEBP-like protein [Aspergillus heteromorphus CBS 117.55]|uniref:PEBP-like protein n=1 Tax=Aspergillus heteromorphus CBS 117.55 TaxID=1448321 RepID=A0A317WRP2_9EURO|nr:PEBP-like protein [Aspergillus heteromorphus CBS 117.55]PWY89069.1 PEBP-like protein [Aspergillus heteromorphus CBS 117.55]